MRHRRDGSVFTGAKLLGVGMASVALSGCAVTGLSKEIASARREYASQQALLAQPYQRFAERAEHLGQRWQKFRYQLTNAQIAKLGEFQECKNRQPWEAFRGSLSTAQKAELAELLAAAAKLEKEQQFLIQFVRIVETGAEHIRQLEQEQARWDAMRNRMAREQHERDLEQIRASATVRAAAFGSLGNVPRQDDTPRPLRERAN